MLQVIKQTKEEQFKMYMKLPKKELIEMLIESNRIIDEFYNSTTIHYFIQDEEIHKMD